MCHPLSCVFQNTTNTVTGQRFSSPPWDILINSPLTHLVKLGNTGKRRLVKGYLLPSLLRLLWKKKKTPVLLLFPEIISDMLIESFDLIRTPRASCQLQIQWTAVVFHASSDWRTFICRSRQVTWRNCQERWKMCQEVKTPCNIFLFKMLHWVTMLSHVLLL